MCPYFCVPFLSFLYPYLSIHSFFFFFNDTATTEIYTLSLHDALPIFIKFVNVNVSPCIQVFKFENKVLDRKSTRLNSSHITNSYAVFCLKKKKVTKEKEVKEGWDRSGKDEGKSGKG